MTQTRPAPAPAGADPDRDGVSSPLSDPARQVGLARLRGRVGAGALVASATAAVGETLGTVVAGRIAVGPSGRLVGLLAALVVGAALLDTVGRTIWSVVVDRAEGRLRADLLSAALAQPLAVLGEQAVGEVLDRVDDDTYEVGALIRRQAWDAVRTAFSAVPLWVVAGLTWWPAWLLFPATGVVVVATVRRLLPEVSRLKVEEEIAWTDHAALMEEGVAGRDDLRTVLGQAYLVRRMAALSARIHQRLGAVLRVETRITLRAGMLLQSLLAVVVVGGVVLVQRDELSVARLITLFLVTSTFVGSIDQLARHLPDLQEGFGAVVRLRQMLESPPEPAGGAALPDGSLGIRLRDLSFSYPQDDPGRPAFALRDVDLEVRPGRVVALVGRTGSGKSTLASLLSRAVEPPAGTVLLGGTDVTRLDLRQLRTAVGVVTQRTDILAGTLAENIALFADLSRSRIESAVALLRLDAWVAGLPDGLDTLLGPGGTTLSAGEEQLVAFARLLVRDVRVVVLDEATARMDPVTEQRVVRASERLLAGRTGIIVAHRLSTTSRADTVAVLADGRVVQQGPRSELARADGLFRTMLLAAGETDAGVLAGEPAPSRPDDHVTAVGAVRRRGTPPEPPRTATGPSLRQGITRALLVHPGWGVVGGGLFLLASITGAFGAVSGFVWGRLVQHLQDGTASSTGIVALTVVLVVLLMDAPPLLALAFRRYPHWWSAVRMRVRQSVLVGQTRQHRLERTPPGEVVARAMDADRFVRYADRWVDVINGVIVVIVTTILGGSLLAGGLLLVVMVVAALASALGRPIAGRSAAAASRARARFGRSLVSALESARTVKLAAATPQVHAHLRSVDGGRVEAAVREHRVQALLDGVPVVMVQLGVVAAWGVYLLGGWDLATALLVATAVSGFGWFGRVAGSAITEAPGTRSWQRATTALAGGGDLVTLPAGVDLVRGLAPTPGPPERIALQHLKLRGVTAVHPDGTVGARDVDLELDRGELVLLLGQVGSGKSSLLGALAGLVDHTGEIRWNQKLVEDAQVFLRPGQVAAVAQVPRVLSGTFADNIALDFTDRPVPTSIADARLGVDVERAGGADSIIGHRGVRLSGGQVQRLALARALAAGPELLLADDVSSALDPTTEVELWASLRARGTTVLGATSKRAALAEADRVVVLVDGEISEVGPWSDLQARWSHLAG